MRELSVISAGNTPKSWQEEFDGIFLPGQLEAQFPAAPVNYTAQPKKILNFALLVMSVEMAGRPWYNALVLRKIFPFPFWAEGSKLEALWASFFK